MSGHSKWAGIKHKKAIVDAKKGKAFTQVANMIAVAARKGGGDPKMNPALALAIQKAKSVNMPATNVERAIKRGTGEGGGAAIEDILYEGYGPGGIAVLVETATDNKNRTVSEVRSSFTKYGGSLGNTGSVAYLFDQKGQIEIELKNQKLSQEEIEMAILDTAAEDFTEEESTVFVYSKANDLSAVKESLENTGIKIENASLEYIPQNEVVIKDKDKAKSILRLMDVLEELDDVVAVHSNFDISEEILKELA